MTKIQVEHPARIMLMPNGMIAAFDENGEQLPEYQGEAEGVCIKLIAELGPKLDNVVFEVTPNYFFALVGMVNCVRR